MYNTSCIDCIIFCKSCDYCIYFLDNEFDID